MTPYQRMFGSGPRGVLASTVSLGAALGLDAWLGLPAVHGSAAFGWAALTLGAAAAVAVMAWSLRSLPPAGRGRVLVTTGPFRFVRHPLYAAFLGPFDLGLTLFLDGWVCVAWAALQYPLWHLNVAAEEKLMRERFGEEYAAYCRRTPRFVPKLV
ncbi:MAG: isoprenylcysteine carboxylmethyltransferase family protein [Alphaproteobacteria bacterium]|nr:isoprenylcysteine carboxylmethyltransferase family protein [Alphaproteobacteria bacterium]